MWYHYWYSTTCEEVSFFRLPYMALPQIPSLYYGPPTTFYLRMLCTLRPRFLACSGVYLCPFRGQQAIWLPGGRVTILLYILFLSNQTSLLELKWFSHNFRCNMQLYCLFCWPSTVVPLSHSSSVRRF